MIKAKAAPNQSGPDLPGQEYDGAHSHGKPVAARLGLETQQAENDGRTASGLAKDRYAVRAGHRELDFIQKEEIKWAIDAQPPGIKLYQLAHELRPASAYPDAEKKEKRIEIENQIL